MSACDAATEPEAGRASPSDSVAAFTSAWNGGDPTGMYETLDEASQKRWGITRLRFLFDNATSAGRITSSRIAIDEPEVGDDETEVAVGYTVTYESKAASEPVEMSGDLTLVYLEEEDRWGVAFDDDLLWPGHEGVTGFGTLEEWPKRAPIVDRDGAFLAKGDGASRTYPQGSVGGTTVGHLEPGVRDRLVGASGLEEAFEDVLAGVPDRRFVLVRESNCKARKQCRRPDHEVIGEIEGEPGRRVKVALDVDVQRAAESAYGGTTGGAVVMEPSTGDILAIVSSSRFDPNNYVGVGGIEPFNRALSGLYPPGSSMKVMTASAALDTGVVKPTTQLSGPAEYQGVRNFESGDFGTLDFATAVKYSVNTAFAQVALDLGAKRLTRYAERFGFNRRPSMALHAATPSFPFPEDAGDLMWGSIGQAQTLATPLQMASVAATVANDGRRMEPRIDLSEDPSGERVMKVATAATMTELMRNVVIGGTGVAANVTGLEVAGKTGTAEVDVNGERKNHAWFICFSPASAPRVAVAVVSEYGGVGGQVAAPLARAILQAVYPNLPKP
jgi:peptidoglycan glycosyltransferase